MLSKYLCTGYLNPYHQTTSSDVVLGASVQSVAACTAPPKLPPAALKRAASDTHIPPSLMCPVFKMNFGMNALLAQNQIQGWAVAVQCKHGQTKSQKSSAYKYKA